MQKLAGIDAAFLYLETPSAHMHVAGTIILDAKMLPALEAPQRIAEHLAGRLGTLALFRKRLVETPLGLTHPWWRDDPDFRPEDHIHHTTAPPPGTMREVAMLAGRIAGRPLHRDRPLWELWTIDGIEDGRIAVIVKVHHALVDGASGTEVLAHLLDVDPAVRELPVFAPPGAGDEASTLAMLTSAAGTLAAQPIRLLRTLIETARSVLGMLDNDSEVRLADERTAWPFDAPRTTFSRAIGPRRAVAFGRAELDQVKYVKNHFGVTVNDVVLGCCTLALRRYLESRGELPDKPLIATVPVSVHAGTDDGEAAANRVSALFVGLPVQLADPVEQLARIHRDTAHAKRVHGRLGGNMLRDWAQLAPPRLVARGAHLYSKMKIADYVRPVHNLVVSNVPGPPFPLYAAGARVLSAYPLGPVLEGAGLNITVFSYRDSIDIGVIACADSVPNPWEISDRIEQALADLVREARSRAETTAVAGSASATVPNATDPTPS